ncbi:hypothetical protein [Intestinibacter sp.]|uniref:hypothetical protein n=1 Tax=Intestinibacter sp. TaxID=1965304 RepID=UPI002A754EE8|nr:hypothetical protein [Intestinibacter sp.]MDY2735483.1 hypothetical protein [Intestinibacter sp.]MDY4575471.1 hypothetical protein [Intestinibacter sp.]
MDVTITDEVLFQLLNIILYIGVIAIVYNYLKNIHNIEIDRDIIKNKTRKNKFSQKKKIICYLGLLISFILMEKDDSSSGVLADKIFKPIISDTWTFYYASIITAVILYFSIKGINEESEFNIIKTPFDRFIAVVVFMYGFSKIWSLISMF